MVECQDERSQYKNKDRAMKILRSRLYEAEQEKQAAQQAAQRKSQVGTGDRSGKIRTYNFPQNRVTDHRLTGDAKNFNLRRRSRRKSRPPHRRAVARRIRRAACRKARHKQKGD